MREAKENKENSITENSDGTYKYQVSDYDLAIKYNLNPEQITAYKNIRGTLEGGIDFYNKQVLKFGKINKELKAVKKVPNYFPHIFPDKFSTWILRTESDGKVIPIANIGLVILLTFLTAFYSKYWYQYKMGRYILRKKS